MADVFLSYARADRPAVEKLAAELQARGYTVWWDADIQSGEEFSKRIQTALDAAKVAVVAWSKTAVESRWVRDEADYALQQTKLASVTIDGTLPPLGFRQFQCTDISAFAAGDAAALGPLIEAVALRLGAAPQPPPVSAAATPPAASSFVRKPLVLAGAATLATILAAVAFLVTSGPPGGRPPPFPEPPGKASATTPDAPRPDAATAQKSVAVLPFIAMSSSEQDGYFADGLTEEVLNSLAAVPSLLVTARTSSFYFKGKDLPIQEIAAKLGVAYVIEGSLRPAGDGVVRITAQLIKASDGTHLWSDTYDRAATDILGVQTEIAEKVAGALGVLLDEKTRRYMEAQDVKSVEAFAAFQKGASLFYEAHAYGPFLVKAAEAQPEFEKATALAPDFSEAWLMHAGIYDRLFMRKLYGAPLKPFAESAPDELHRLILSDLNEAYRGARTPHRRVMIDYIRTLESDDWTGLGAKLDAALAGKECLGNLGWISSAHVFGRLDAMIAFMERRKACDPFDPGAYGTIMDLYAQAGDLDAARANIAKGRELFGQRPPYDTTEFLLELAARDFAAARAILPRLRGGEWSAIMLTLAEGSSEAPSDLRKKFEALMPPNMPPDAHASQMLTFAAWSGDRAEAARLASEIDKRPFGAEFLMMATTGCWCGSPFPIEAAPNFARRLNDAALEWAPQAPIRWPAKDW